MSIYLRYAKLKTLKLYLLFNYKHFKKCFIYLVSYSYSDDLFIPFPILQIFLFYFWFFIYSIYDSVFFYSVSDSADIFVLVLILYLFCFWFGSLFILFLIPVLYLFCFLFGSLFILFLIPVLYLFCFWFWWSEIFFSCSRLTSGGTTDINQLMLFNVIFNNPLNCERKIFKLSVQ